MRTTQCCGCWHDKSKHGPHGCTARTMMEGFRGPDGRCTCKCFRTPELSPEKRKAIHQGQIKACFAAGRAR